jgi:hypothetical protein
MMLLKALLTRLVGGAGPNGNGATGKSFRASKLTYEKYPVLAQLVIRLLQDDSALQQSFEDACGLSPDSGKQIRHIFAGLEIIDLVGIPRSQTDIVKSLLYLQLGSAVWNLRDKAAKILGLMSSQQQILNELVIFLQKKSPPQNEIHGRLLCLKHFMFAEYPEHTRKSLDSNHEDSD